MDIYIDIRSLIVLGMVAITYLFIDFWRKK